MATLKPDFWAGFLRGVSFRATAGGAYSAFAFIEKLLSRFGLRKAPDPLSRAVPLYRQGKSYYQTREFERAKAAFEQLVQLVPTNGGAWYYLGRIDWIDAKFSAALEKFERAVVHAPDNANAKAWVHRARLRVANSGAKARRKAALLEGEAETFERSELDWLEVPLNRDEALESASELVASQLVAHPLAVARKYLAEGSAADALAVCEAILPEEAGFHEVQALMARAYLRQGEFAAALVQFQSVYDDDAPISFLAEFAEILLEVAILRKGSLKRDLASAIRWDQIGKLAARLDEADKPLAGFALRRAVWLRSGKFDDVKEAVGALVATGRATAAVQFLRELQLEIPSNKSIYILQADIFLAQNRFAEAKKALLEGARELPGDAAILIKLAKLFSEHNRWAEAIKAWREAAEASPKTPSIIVEIADCYRKDGQYEKAVQEYRIALNREPGNEKIYRGLSQSLRRLGRQHDAIAVLRRLVEIAPKNFQNWNELIYTIARAELANEAVAALEKAESVLGSDPATIRKLVLSAERALMTDEAEQLLKRIIAERPKLTEPVIELGKHYLRQGLLRQADGAFMQAIALGAEPESLAHEVNYIANVRTLLGIEDRDAELVIPEDVIKHIASRRQELQRAPAIPGQVAIITTKLASGGAERQTAITAASVCASTDVVSGVSMHCLSLSSERGHDFYLPLLKGSAIEVNEPCVADLEEALETPELSEYADLLWLLPPDLGYMVAIWTLDFMRKRPEVVHAWQDSAAIGGALAAILAGVPRVVLSTRNTRPDNKYRRWKRYMFDAYNAFHAQGIMLSNNSKAGGLDYDEWLKLPPGSTEIVYNGVDFSRLDEDRTALSPQEIKARLGIPEDARVMGGVFRLSGEKQPLLWVETAALVAKRFPKMHFIICGQGTMRNDIMALGASLGIGDRLHLPGNQRPIAPWYCAMDIFLLSSRKEGLPNVLLEAQFLNVPVVATDVGGVREVMDNGVSGWTVVEQQAEMLADRVIYALENDAWHARAREAGRAYVKQTFSVETMRKRTLEVYGYG